jgi:hypothetical protein
MAKARKKMVMTSAHKKALAEGRELGRGVKNYLEALEANRPKRGRQRTPESIKKRLDTIKAAAPDSPPLQRLQLVQEELDLQAELTRLQAKVDLSGLEREFVRVAKPYSERKGITYAAWRELGVSAEVLKKAGITRAN